MDTIAKLATFGAALALGAVVLTAAPTSAEGNGTTVTANHRLRAALVCGTGAGETLNPNLFKFTSGSDSPTDANNNKALRTTVTAPGEAGCDYRYAQAYTTESVSLAEDVGTIKNLSFEFHNTEYVGAGSPRISVQFGNGDVAYLSGFYCNNPLAVSPSWSRADFTGRKAVGCAFYGTGETFPAGPYESTGTQSAWQVYAAANPDQVVTAAYILLDEPGTYSLDRISLGTGKMYNISKTRAVNCATETAC